MSVYVQNLTTGEVIDDYRSDKVVPPAAVMKLLTTAACLETMGPDALANCRHLSVSLSENHPAFHLKDSMLFDKEEKILYMSRDSSSSDAPSLRMERALMT